MSGGVGVWALVWMWVVGAVRMRESWCGGGGGGVWVVGVRD